ncbi:MAG: GDP-mannose-dependent alpha-(1-6)-phosphatidylinositol monomannoside mannosyltransferase [Thermocaproicibacter melissae]|uniref:glycosyltransferase n=1 Tax=Thermocaproicibacter melissae TaxID=2966552 RepID=UPI003A0FD24D
MKVLQINSCCGVGSTGRIAADIYKALEEQGHQCKIAYGRGNAPEDIDTIRIGSSLDNYLHVIKTRIFDQHGFGSENATRALIKQIENYDPNIIHLHNVHGYYVNIDILFNYLKEAGKPVVWTLHDCWAFTGHCAYFDYIGCDRWKTGCYKCPQKKKYPSSILMDNSKRNFEKKRELFTGVKNMVIVTPSKWLAGLVKKSFLSEYPVKVINNGVDLEVFKPTKNDFRKKYGLENKFIILGVANIWDKRKGYDYFIKLSEMLKQDEIIVMVGVTEKQRKNLPKNIIGITRTNNVNELAEIYSAADVFINPTLEEVLGLVNLEALACGTPVVTFNTGGSPECIDESCGVVVEKGNLKELVNALEIMKNRGKSSYLWHCVKRTQQFFDMKDNFKEYLSLYMNVKMTS